MSKIYRRCQKEDWRNHKKHCGKKKVSKKLPGTIHDHLWRFSHLPDCLRHLSSGPALDGMISLDSIGFANPNIPLSYAPALQRQVDLLTADKTADYFLFDDTDSPVRVVIHGYWMKMAFRTLRTDSLSANEKHGLEALAEYLIKIMGEKPGLSRGRILEQLEREYGGDVAEKVAQFEQMSVMNGFEGSTFLEVMGGNLMATMPAMMAMGQM